MSSNFSSVGSSCVPNVPKEAFLHGEITVKFTKIYESLYGNCITAITQDCRHCKHKQEYKRTLLRSGSCHSGLLWLVEGGKGDNNQDAT